MEKTTALQVHGGLQRLRLCRMPLYVCDGRIVCFAPWHCRLRPLIWVLHLARDLGRHFGARLAGDAAGMGARGGVGRTRHLETRSLHGCITTQERGGQCLPIRCLRCSLLPHVLLASRMHGLLRWGPH